MVLTEEQKQDIYPVASLEDSKIATEQNYYDINPNQPYCTFVIRPKMEKFRKAFHGHLKKP